MFMFACSLGAICANLYLMNDAEHSPIKAAAFYGTPLNPLGNSPFFTNTVFGFYNWILGSNLTKKLAPLFPDLYKYSNQQQIERYETLLFKRVPQNLDNVDEYVVAPMFGYKDRNDYRRQCSVNGKLHKLKIPCFYLHAWDDIILGKEAIPASEFQTVENLIFATTKYGSHCCHLQSGFGGILPTQWF